MPVFTSIQLNQRASALTLVIDISQTVNGFVDASGFRHGLRKLGGPFAVLITFKACTFPSLSEPANRSMSSQFSEGV